MMADQNPSQHTRQDTRQAADAHFRVAVVRRLCGNMAGAAASYQRAIHLSTSDPAGAYTGLGIALLQMGRGKEALAACLKATQLRPDSPGSFVNLGRTAARLGHARVAILAFQKAVALDPAHAQAHHELGCAEYSQGQLERAREIFRRAIALDGSNSAASRHHLAMVTTLLGEPEGLVLLEQLVRERPLYAAAHFQWSVGLLLHGEYERGWEQHEWRLLIESHRSHHPAFTQPRWQGEALRERSILLYSEQGFGDTLQFARYARLLAERGGRVILEVERPLERLLRGLPGVAECVVRGQPRPPFSFYAPLMSLSHLFQTTLATIPPPVAPAVPEMNAPRLGRRAGFQVGIAWAGSPRHERDALRSTRLADWKPLLQIAGVAFTSLQRGPAICQVAEHGTEFGFVEDDGRFWDFADTAAVIAELDLVITVDTSVAHLAGTMGKPVWILLANVLDWRWGLKGTDSAWYPTARLFRQTTPGDWRAVMKSVEIQLQLLVHNSGASPPG